MKRNSIVWLIAISSSSLIFGQYNAFSDRHLIIGYTDSTSAQTIAGYHADFVALGAELVKACPCKENLELWETSAVNLETLRSTASEKSGVDTTDYDYIMSLDDPTDDDFFRSQNVSLQSAFAETNYLDIQPESKAAAVKVAVLDSGVDPDHPQLSDRLWTGKQPRCIEGAQIGYDFKYDDQIPDDSENHGSGVNGVLLDQVSPKVVECSNAKFYAGGSGRLFDAICGIYLSIEQEVKIINMSFGYESDTASIMLYGAMRAAAQNDIFMVASAGNTNSNNNVVGKWPANFAKTLKDHMIVVAAYHIENNDTILPDYTSYGTASVHLAAPGHVITTNHEGGYEEMYGTSIAAPYVTRTALMLLSKYSALSSPELISCILRSVRSVDGFGNKLITGGILDHAKALTCNAIFPLVTSSFRGSVHEDGISLDWRGYQDLALEHYEVWRSTDVDNWTWMANLPISSDDRYNWKDKKPTHGSNYYKIRHLSTDGSMSESNILEFKFHDLADEVFIYPNPVGLGERLNIILPQKMQVQKVGLCDPLGAEHILFESEDEIEYQEFEIDLKSMTTGYYTLRVFTPGYFYSNNVVITR